MRDNDYTQGYIDRNAFAAAVESLVRSYASPEEYLWNKPSGLDKGSRVRTGQWVYGFHMECEGLNRKAESNIIRQAVRLFPRLHVSVLRKTTLRNRYVEFSFR
jgi:hypothetical protein